MSDEIMDNIEETNEAPAENKISMTQEEFDRKINERLARERRKYEKQLEGVDLDEARRLMEEKQQAELERQKEKGEFEKVLKTTVEKKDTRITQLEKELERVKIDGELVSAASRNGAVSPDQVVQLLKGQTRLDEAGQVEILDSDGSVRYNDDGSPLSVSEYVSSFLTANPHFVKASPSGTGSKGAAGGSTPKPESVADMLANWETGGKEAFAALRKGKR
jgi:hypothetical protein